MTAQQKPHQSNIGVPVQAQLAVGDLTPPPVDVPKDTADDDVPVRVISSEVLMTLGQRMDGLFQQYRADRRISELRWLRNQRQYLGIYDPEIEMAFNPNRSKAYPKTTRVKCITVLSHLMNLMFPGNERNWEIEPAPSPDLTMDDVKEAIAEAQKRDQEAGQPPAPMDIDYAMDAVHQMMVERADKLTVVIDDQLQELGGDQHYDYIALNREVIQSGINYGLGLLRGPFARECKTVEWVMPDSDAPDQTPVPKAKKCFKPMFQFIPIWDFYPDLAAKTFGAMDGYFLRHVMGKSQVKALCKHPGFFPEQIESYLAAYPRGNYKALEFELELRVMGVRMNVNDQKPDTQKYEMKAWIGKVDGTTLRECGAEVPEDKLTEELDAEVWFIDGHVIKCAINPWSALGHDVRMLHHFLYDRDDTSPIGFGLPYAMRDSQLMVAAATRMLLDNASIVCGPNLELNTKLLRAEQDLSSIRSYRIWYRDDDDPATAQYPAVRNVAVDAHMKELMQIIELGMKFADIETFVGPANGADPESMPSEPMRTAAGASALRGQQALPFKDMVRSFDSFTQSVLLSIVMFNKVFNPTKAHEGDYNIIARGATSLIAKEVMGANADQLASTLTPEEKLHVDARKLLTIRLKSRDMADILVSDSEAQRRQAQQDQDDQKKQQQADEMSEAMVRKILSDGYKNIAAGQKNVSAADAATVNSFMEILERGIAINASAAGATPQPSPTDPSNGAVPQLSQAPGPVGPSGPQAPGVA